MLRTKDPPGEKEHRTHTERRRGSDQSTTRPNTPPEFPAPRANRDRHETGRDCDRYPDPYNPTTCAFGAALGHVTDPTTHDRPGAPTMAL
ncbi:hypothetical protein GCM10010493_00880 [Streptomyces lavendulae subsp. grasserius]